MDRQTARSFMGTLICSRSTPGCDCHHATAHDYSVECDMACSKGPCECVEMLSTEAIKAMKDKHDHDWKAENAAKAIRNAEEGVL